MIALAENTVGLLDTCVVIELGQASLPVPLPTESMVSAITLAELSYGIPLASDPLEATRRAQVYAQVKAWITPVPFDAAAADKYGELVALVLKTGRSPRPRRLDLMIAATAASLGVPLYTRDGDAFSGLEPLISVVLTEVAGCPSTGSGTAS